MKAGVCRPNFSHLPTRLLPILLGILALGGLLLVAQPAFAVVCNGTANDPDTCTGKAGGGGTCLGDLSGFGSGINCTANDVKIGFADNVLDANGNPILSCISGSTVNFTADFHVETSGGVTRYDIGLYFATDGDPDNNGAKSGACAVSKISSANNVSGNFINLDLPANGGSQAADTCGDINDTHKPQTVRVSLSAPCTASPLFFNPATGQCQVSDNGGTLTDHCMLLPNGVSWRQTGANNVCDSPLDAFPGTTSKCNVNPTFGIPVIVETASLAVVKTATPTSRPETGGTITYSVTITNSASFVSVTINTINDDVYGDLTTLAACGAGEPSAGTPGPCTPPLATSCPSLVGTVLAPGGSASCSFDAFVSGNNGDTITDTVTVCGTDSASHNICGEGTATVTITDVATAPSLTKAAQSAANCQLDVTYQVVVTNNSAVDTLTVNALTDNKFGIITTAHNANQSCGAGSVTCEQVVTACTLSQNPIPAGGNASCTFVGRITSATCSFTHTNNVTGDTTDSDGSNFTPSDPDGGASVTVSAPTLQ